MAPSPGPHPDPRIASHPKSIAPADATISACRVESRLRPELLADAGTGNPFRTAIGYNTASGAVKYSLPVRPWQTARRCDNLIAGPARVASMKLTPNRTMRRDEHGIARSLATIAIVAGGLMLSACMDPGSMGGGMPGMGGSGSGLLGSAPARTPQERAMEVEPMLTAAGFQTLSPQQPAHQQQLASLPALRLHYYTTPDGQQRYWYADPNYCHCLYVGDAAAYQRY